MRELSPLRIRKFFTREKEIFYGFVKILYFQLCRYQETNLKLNVSLLIPCKRKQSIFDVFYLIQLSIICTVKIGRSETLDFLCKVISTCRRTDMYTRWNWNIEEVHKGTTKQDQTVEETHGPKFNWKIRKYCLRYMRHQSVNQLTKRLPLW